MESISDWNAGLFLLAIVWWIGGAFAVADAAKTRGESAFGWFMMGALFGPIAAPLMLIARKSGER